MKNLRSLLFYAILCVLTGCTGRSAKKSVVLYDSTASPKEVIESEDILTNRVLSAEEQKALQPEQVLEILKEGNADFTEDRLTIRNTSTRIRAAAASQFPKAVILSCLDSRIPVEDVFHRGIGDIFVARVAGNIANEDIIGSMEYGCKVSGAKLLVVLGHESCGAIKAAIDDVKLGNITALLAKIRPAVKSVKGFNERSSKDHDFLHAVCEANVRQTIAQIRKMSPILKEMEENRELKIVGGIYNMNSGKVNFWE